MSVKHYNVTGKPYPRRQYMLEYAAKHKERRRENFRKWQEKNREHRRKYCRDWGRSHPDVVRERNRIQSLKNKEQRAIKSKEYREKNREKISLKMREYHKKNYPIKRELILRKTTEYAKSHPEVRHKCYLNYKRKNPHYHSVKSAQRRVKILSLPTDEFVDGIIVSVKAKKTFKCYYCQRRFSRSEMHIDHIIPIARGGSHTSDNICSSCKTCNLTKNQKTLDRLTFIEQRLLPL